MSYHIPNLRTEALNYKSAMITTTPQDFGEDVAYFGLSDYSRCSCAGTPHYRGLPTTQLLVQYPLTLASHSQFAVCCAVAHSLTGRAMQQETHPISGDTRDGMRCILFRAPC